MPSAPPAIDVVGLSKTYRLWERPSTRMLAPLKLRLARTLHRFNAPLGERLERAVHTGIREHRALTDINLRLSPGESLGIIGLNGSGKSTLLQIIAGVMQPSAGQVRVRGRVAALLELGSGFNPELTGRENIGINAAILGLSAEQLRARLPEIIAFADIGDYIDQPVKAYSSGMALRLAFAVQVHVDPDVLIVDEALAVGDAQFQAKAMAKIDEILARGTTLLFVGHDLNAVRAFCKRAMLLEKGRIVMDGAPDEVVTEYLYRSHRQTLHDQQQAPDRALQRIDFGYGSDEVHVARARINGADRHVSVRFDEPLTVELRLHLRADLSAPMLIFDVMDGKGLQISGRRLALPTQARNDELDLRIAFPARLQKGIYRIRMRIAESPSLERTTILARQEGWLSFDVVDDSRSRFTGLFPLPMDVCFAEQ